MAARLAPREETRLRLSLQLRIDRFADAAGRPGWLYGQVQTEAAGHARRTGLIALGVFTAGALVLTIGPYSRTGVVPPEWLRYANFAAVCAAMTLRKRAPRVGLLIGTTGFLCDVIIGSSIPTIAVYTDNLYSAAVHGPRTLPRRLIVGSVALSLLGAAWVYYADGTSLAVMAFTLAALILLSPIMTGMIVREHRERATLERDRADKIAQLAAVDRRAALAEERTRMARELHDTIANHFSAIAMRSSAVMARTDMDAEEMRAVIADIRTDSVAGLGEMRRTIEVLRSTDGEDETVQHRLSDIDDMVSRLRAAGLTVRTRQRGQAHELPIAIEFAAYRIVQEALTNVLKHGHDAEVDIVHGETELVITVDNRLRQETTAVPGSGNGLLGMRERAGILGGQLDAGPYEGGWRVRAVLPAGKEE